MMKPCLAKARPGLFSTEDVSSIDLSRVPRHIAIIPDGNRRWAKRHGKVKSLGHRAGADNIIDTVKAAKELGVKALTFYLFSTENWNRPQEEISVLMWLLKDFLIGQCNEMLEHGVKLNTIGDLSAFSADVLEVIETTKEKTAHCDKVDMILALNYGARNEMCRVMKTLVAESIQGKFQMSDINEELISKRLDTAPWGDPDLLIRTSGELRVSNFLLWQLSYTELYVTDVLWPDFKSNNLLDAVASFQKRERRLGGT